jgi:hypothetical protein
MELITTTVAVDAQKRGDQVVLHLVKGDHGTIRFMFVPTAGGKRIDISQAAQAKVRAHSTLWQPAEDILLNCTISGGNVYMTPTETLTWDKNEFEAQLVLIKPDTTTLSSLPFTIIVHDTVYEGDAVQRTNNSLTDLEWTEATLTLTAQLKDGTEITVQLPHVHPAADSDNDGFMTSDMYDLLQQLQEWMDQGVKTTDDPTFAGLHIGNLTIDSQGNITGARFT